MKLQFIFILCAFTISLSFRSVQCYNILMALMIESKSVHTAFTSIAKDLVAANHSVTLIGSYDSSYSHTNFTDINVVRGRETVSGNLFLVKEARVMTKLAKDSIEYIGKAMWENQEIQKLWRNRHSFDAIIMLSICNSIVLPFAFNNSGPLIYFVSPGVEYSSLAADGNWLPPSTVPSLFVPYDEDMNFFERTVNFVSLFVNHYLWSRPVINFETTVLRQYFPEIGDLSSYYRKGALTLINSLPAMDSPVPLLPNQVEIGTINAHPPRPLPQDLEEFVSSSGDYGIIYFSLGSFVRSSHVPQEAKLAFVDAFRRVPQKVIWGYEDDDLDLPPNVLTRPWLPQQDILGHPKTRVYISHCGIQSSQEAKYHGVPVLAMPITFDQPRNAARMVRKNIAVSLSWDTLTSDDIVDALNVLVNDTSYSERMKQISALLQDQRESPGERAVWWIEYVIRHRGAPHLQYTGKQLHLLQYICADVIAFLVVCLYIAYRLIKAVIVFFLRWLGQETGQKKFKTS